jgi:DNA repair photolyase
VKQVDERSLLGSLRRARRSGLEVAVGPATDPYQPAEAKFGITRKVLLAARRVPGLALGLTTKSTLVTRDLDLLLEIAGHSRLWVNLSIITLDAGLTRRLEPRAPRPDLRVRAMETLARAGIATRLFIMPILPGLTDGDGTLRPLLEAAHGAGCGEARWNVLFLRSGTREVFLKLIADEFPRLTDRYRALYARSAYVPRAYWDLVERRIVAHARAVGLALPAREESASDPSASSSSRPRQLSLIW